MLTCIDDYSKNDLTVFVFSDSSEVETKQNHEMSPPTFILTTSNSATAEQKQAIKSWSGCPVA
jgi:hypothetical protein